MALRFPYIVIIILMVSTNYCIRKKDNPTTPPAKTATTEQKKQPETFEFSHEGETYHMQKYFLVLLKKGPNRTQNKEQADKIQQQHLAHLSKMYDDGYMSLSGPIDDENSDILGICVYHTATQDEAYRLANQDPAVKSGRLTIEILPWWSAKGFKLK